MLMVVKTKSKNYYKKEFSAEEKEQYKQKKEAEKVGLYELYQIYAGYLLKQRAEKIIIL